MSTSRFIPYGRQTIDDDDIAAVVEVLRSDWLTTGPAVERFEADICAYVGARHGVAVSNGTAALHAAMFALNIGPGDEVIVPPMTFAASANCVLYQGGRPVFADVDAGTLLLDPAAAEAAITPRTKAIIGVDYAGQPCDWDALRALADKHHLALVADGCHALGASLDGRKVGTLADITVFSFHPVKHITTGEGGMAVTDDETLAARIRAFRGHGITTTAYDAALAGQEAVRPLTHRENVRHAYHLYVVRTPDRDETFRRLRANGIGANVHYVPVHLHPYYRQVVGTREGLCPVAEAAYREILTLPLWPGMTEIDIERITRSCIYAQVE